MELSCARCETREDQTKAFQGFAAFFYVKWPENIHARVVKGCGR